MKIHDRTIQCKRKGMISTFEVSNVHPPPSPSKRSPSAWIMWSLFTCSSSYFYRRMCLTQDIVWFSLLDWIEMESYWLYFSVICSFHSRLCFWDLSIWCAPTDIFNLAEASLSSSYITLIQSKLNFILWATSCLFTFIYNNVWLYHKSSISDLG